MIQENKLYTEPQIGVIMQLSRATLLRLRKENKIPFYKVSNGSVRYSLEEVKEALRKG